jgi:hypothetical protein
VASRRIDAVVVSSGYSDFLAWSLPTARSVFDRLVVVTSSTDEPTKRVCRHYHVECVETDAFYDGGAAFNKGAAIDVGLNHLDFPEWCVHLDADVVLPPRAGELLRTVELHEQMVYGVDRLMVPSYDAWVSFLSSPTPQHYPGSAWPVPFPVGYRCVYADGYVPIGFFQMFHRESAYLGRPLYPTQFPTAADSDVVFARQWPRGKRALIPELFLYHLGSETEKPNKIGANWQGRRTRRFGPCE